MPQAVTAVLAAGAVIGVPVAAGQAMQPDKPALPPHDEEISVQAEGDEDVDEGFRVLFEASGKPQRRTTLRNEDGLETALALRRASCEGVRGRSIGYDGPAPEDWCLKIESLPAHEQVSGVVEGTALVETEPAIRLVLTVDHRDEFFPWPAAAMAGGLFLGLVAGVGFGLGAPRITRLQLRQKVSKNERAARADRIKGLRERVEALLDGGHNEGELLDTVKVDREERSEDCARRSAQAAVGDVEGSAPARAGRAGANGDQSNRPRGG
jgi:hypothetical protein